LGCVKKVVTELGVFDITERGFELKEIAPGVSIEEVKAKTLGRLVVEGDIKEVNVL
jgi:acyl CoA:acetate/3-ketoacid CoA transferase beta subunit